MKKESADVEMYNKIINLRLALGLSKAEFGRQIGYSPTHIARLERGETKPRMEVINKIADNYGIDIQYFTDDMTLGDATANSDRWNHRKWVKKDDIDDDVPYLYDGGASVRIKELRKEYGLSQRSFAKIANVDSSMISMIESGKDRMLSVISAKKIADAFDVGYEWLLYGVEERRDYPVNDKMIKWLWSDVELRKKIWQRINECTTNPENCVPG